MSVTNKALFILERNSGGAVTLDEIANRCQVSCFHLAHAFGEATGWSVIEYLRGRRLSAAAQVLADGADNILQVALESGYGSHEAFSRAFKTRFGQTPEDVRKAGSTDAIALVEAHPHLESKSMTLKEPRIEQAGRLLFVGWSRHVPFKAMQTIAGQWAEFMGGPYGDIEGKLAEPPVGVTLSADEDGVIYACAAGVPKFAAVPKGCVKITIAPSTYVVFEHEGHVTQLRETYRSIWNDWFPTSGTTPAEAPSLERHNRTFDPDTGEGGVAIWIPIEP